MSGRKESTEGIFGDFSEICSSTYVLATVKSDLTNDSRNDSFIDWANW